MCSSGVYTHTSHTQSALLLLLSCWRTLGQSINRNYSNWCAQVNENHAYYYDDDECCTHSLTHPILEINWYWTTTSNIHHHHHHHHIQNIMRRHFIQNTPNSIDPLNKWASERICALASVRSYVATLAAGTKIHRHAFASRGTDWTSAFSHSMVLWISFVVAVFFTRHSSSPSDTHTHTVDGLSFNVAHCDMHAYACIHTLRLSF